MSQPSWLRIEGARQNNLKNISVAIPHDRVTVVTEAVDESFVPPSREEGRRLSQQRFGVPDRYVLYVGQFDPRKNVRGLLRAFAQAADRDRDLRLVIAGDLGANTIVINRGRHSRHLTPCSAAVGECPR